MYGYKITFEGFPKTVAAFETKITDYNWINKHPDNMLEIGISKTDYIVRALNNIEHTYQSINSLSCTVAEEGAYSYSTPDTEVNITSLIVTFDKLNVVKKELDKDDVNDHSVLLLPNFDPAVTADHLNEINILMHKYIHYNSQNTLSNNLMKVSILYEILTKMDAYTRRQLSQDAEKMYMYNQYYIKKINSMIHKAYNTKISSSVIAKELGISNGYLSSMYKKATGITISEYILMTRMKKAEEFLKNNNLSTGKIAAMVGYENESSFRKRFKQYFGLNIKEYKIIKQGHALYHEKPTKQYQDSHKKTERCLN